MITDNINGISVITRIEIICDGCGIKLYRTIKGIRHQRKKIQEDKDYCGKCAAKRSAHKKPQCTAEYWTDIKKQQHGEAIKTEKYYSGIAKRNTTGVNNSMYNKKHTDDTKRKMSIARTGKIGENATGWKGGINSLTRRIKGYQYRNGWYKKIYERDGYQCSECGSTKQLEVHHIIPIKIIVNEINKNCIELNDDEKYKYAILLDIITDVKLKNGKTLCRSCHKKEHGNFGSHNPI